MSITFTSSASFPNPPQKPPSNASPDEQALFWKLLHNYYAILARPRFGKRSDSIPSYLTIPHDSIPSFSSEYDMDHMPNEYFLTANDHQSNIGNALLYGYPGLKRRRRR